MDPKAPKIVRRYMEAPARVVERYAAAVLPFKARPGVPTFKVRGDKYVLSTDGGPLGDREDDADQPSYGGRLIGPDPNANKWRYLWAYDTEKQIVAMWRISDGSEKVEMPARSAGAYIVRLEKRGQLNRVTTAEFRAIRSEMEHQEDEAIKSMQETLDAAKGAAEKQLDGLVRAYFEKEALPVLQRGLSDVRDGATPIGFKPMGPAAQGDEAWLLRQKSSHVLGQVFRREMDVDKVIGWLVRQGFDPFRVHDQAIDWAIGDVQDMAAEKYLPPRPPG